MVTGNATSYVAADGGLGAADHYCQEGALQEDDPSITWLFQTSHTPHDEGFFDKLVGQLERTTTTPMTRTERLTRVDAITTSTVAQDSTNSRQLRTANKTRSAIRFRPNQQTQRTNLTRPNAERLGAPEEMTSTF